ncbi:hypothetical protein GS682_33115, partial [Nostoc sp. B(2019)]|nr:hypothetical protein [Nostoc sp. B(2019)]
MLSSKHIQPYRIAFIEYTVGHEDINLFENLFCSVMGFQKVNEFVSCNSKRHSVYSFNCTQIVLSEDLSSYENQSAVISGIGFHLNINDAKSHFSDDKNEYHIELYKNQLVKRALELDINASPQNSGNHLLSQSIKVAGINLYFTNNKKSNAYKNINLLIKEDTTLASKLTKTNDNNLSKNTVWMKDLHLHHCALYVNQDDRKTLSNFFKHCLQMKLGLSYILPEAELEVFPYKVNR